MKEQLSRLASTTEIVTSIGVVLSLIFVGLQVRDANRETRAATLRSAADTELYLAAEVANHAATWDKLLNGEPLTSGAETRKGIILFNMLMIESENRFHQFNSGYLSAQSWEGRLSTLRQFANLPIYRVWRNSPGGKGHSADFLELLDGFAPEAPSE